ncbi:hypothetical protein PsorP6_007803 [Peronosclerospora sorghi]|uniref:Uncharacterized protein n=1 Tax=Peronosclerospora sorghi TaxID=230839 RepID=A0ACC0W712_9STRA|nr:hypothetical protein PsorP6_007803 [Peronosclerospora sorghi]
MLACVASHAQTRVAPRRLLPQLPDDVQKGPYTMIKELGSGLHGCVLMAYDNQLERPVAVKLPAALTLDALITESVNVDELEQQVASIIHECNALRRVQHPNVLELERLVAGTKRAYDYVALVTEYVPNGDLFSLIEAAGALPEPLVKVYACQLLRALEACHANGVVHRDVKPENLLLDANYQLKLADFGVVAVAPLGADATDVWSRDESGTALFMAPEIKSGHMYRGPPVDVWATGIVLFILLTGLPPFNEAEKGDVWYDDLVAGDVDQFWKTQPDEVHHVITPGAQDLISSMLTPPDQRITVTEALQHPWLRGADCVDVALIRHAVSTHLEAALAASRI